MGGAVVKSINGSKKPEVYFELELYPSLKDMFDVLALTYEESLKVSETQSLAAYRQPKVHLDEHRRPRRSRNTRGVT